MCTVQYLGNSCIFMPSTHHFWISQFTRRPTPSTSTTQEETKNRSSWGCSGRHSFIHSSAARASVQRAEMDAQLSAPLCWLGPRHSTEPWPDLLAGWNSPAAKQWGSKLLKIMKLWQLAQRELMLSRQVTGTCMAVQGQAHLKASFTNSLSRDW